MVNVQEQHYSYQLYKKKDFARDYEKDRFGSRFGRYLKAKERDIYATLVPDCEKLIDIGAGTGKLAIHLAQPASFVVATDASLEMLRVAAQLARQADKNIALVVCDAHHLCFKDKAFDVAVSSRVLMHLVHWKTALSEYCRICRKSVIIDFPFAASFTIFERLWRNVLKCFKTAQSYRAFWPATIESEYRKNGFRTARAQKLYFLPVFFHRVLGRIHVSEKMEKWFNRIGLTARFGSPVILRADARQQRMERNGERR